MPTAWEGSRLWVPRVTSRAGLTSEGRAGVKLKVHQEHLPPPLVGMTVHENWGAVGGRPLSHNITWFNASQLLSNLPQKETTGSRKLALQSQTLNIPRLICWEGWGPEKGGAHRVTVPVPQDPSPLSQLDYS